MPTALIIDDDPYNLEVLGNLLTLENIAYTAVQDQAQLEGVLKESASFDIVFLDLEFPDTDGYEILKYLKERANITAPIVACTVHSSEMNNASKHGFNGFVGKPLDPDRFSEQVKRLLAGGPVWDLR